METYVNIKKGVQHTKIEHMQLVNRLNNDIVFPNAKNELRFFKRKTTYGLASECIAFNKFIVTSLFPDEFAESCSLERALIA